MFQMLQFLVCVCGGSNSTGPPVFSYSPLLDWLPATFLCLWCLSYSLGLGPIPWAYSNELLPTDVRAQLYSLTACLVCINNQYCK